MAVAGFKSLNGYNVRRQRIREGSERSRTNSPNGFQINPRSPERTVSRLHSQKKSDRVLRRHGFTLVSQYDHARCHWMLDVEFWVMSVGVDSLKPEPVIILVRADPKPRNHISLSQPKRAVVITDADDADPIPPLLEFE
jgi:hypothetical protein